MLLPPDLRDWLDDHLAWFVIDAVAELDYAALAEAAKAGRIEAKRDLDQPQITISTRSRARARRFPPPARP
jgi:hypothetical protein